MRAAELATDERQRDGIDHIDAIRNRRHQTLDCVPTLRGKAVPHFVQHIARVQPATGLAAHLDPVGAQDGARIISQAMGDPTLRGPILIDDALDEADGNPRVAEMHVAARRLAPLLGGIEGPVGDLRRSGEYDLARRTLDYIDGAYIRTRDRVATPTQAEREKQGTFTAHPVILTTGGTRATVPLWHKPGKLWENAT